MSHLVPRANSAKKVYIARRRWGTPEGTPATLGAGGEGVQFVNDPGIADEVVVIHVDGRPIDRQSAIALTKAALKDQKRQAKGKKGRNAVDQIIADLSEPQRSVRSSKKKGGFSWRNWALAGCVGWIALVIAAGVPLGILLTPLVGPLFGWMAAGMLSIVFDDRW